MFLVKATAAFVVAALTRSRDTSEVLRIFEAKRDMHVHPERYFRQVR